MTRLRRIISFSLVIIGLDSSGVDPSTSIRISSVTKDREDIIKECTDRLNILNDYAPKMMDEDKIREVINGVLAEMGIDSPTAKDKGKIMKVLMPKVKGKADGKLVNEIFTTFLQ